jgi:hypothetical protein
MGSVPRGRFHGVGRAARGPPAERVPPVMVFPRSRVCTAMCLCGVRVSACPVRAGRALEILQIFPEGAAGTADAVLLGHLRLRRPDGETELAAEPVSEPPGANAFRW